MNNKRQTLLRLLLGSEEYRKNYILYKAKVEKRYPPLNLLRELPYHIKMELINLWEREIRKIKR